ncbi:MAG TPA: ABC transporter permease [Streptosporangiaceae bacterium]|nr:ABC transporter permease [Streptosporangiaceae bacterium]
MATLRTPGASEAGTGTDSSAVPGRPAGPAAAGLPLAGGGSIAGARSIRRMARAITANRKATAGAVLLLFFILIATFPGVIAHDDPNAQVYTRLLGVSSRHLLGTTALGQDMFAQLVYGARPVLLIAFGVGLLATVVAMLVGVAAAYLGGAWDGTLNVITDVLLVIPLFPLLIIIGSYLHGAGTSVMIAVIAATGWSYTARQLRAQALSLRNRDFLNAAKVRGERPLYVICVEIIPTMTSLLVAAFLTNALYAVLFSSSLQFIGLGDPNVTSWGTMLYWAENNEAFQVAPLWIIAPGLCIIALGAAFALLNYAFDEIGNPALRPVRGKRKVRAQRAR